MRRDRQKPDKVGLLRDFVMAARERLYRNNSATVRGWLRCYQDSLKIRDRCGMVGIVTPWRLQGAVVFI
jgi:hypothetical protein